MSAGNGSNSKAAVASQPAKDAGNGFPVKPQRVKKLGGVTGKGFMPGQSGNPKGGQRRPKELAQFGQWLRGWLAKQITYKRDDKSVKTTRVEWLVGKIAEQKPDVLLHYAYGKPVEMMQVAAAEGAPIEFVVKLRQEQLP